jgi:hypothetical protein
MPSYRPAGSLNQIERAVQTKDGTSCVGASPCVRSLAADHPELAKFVASPRDAALAALQYVEETIERQEIGLELHKVGPFYGDHSDLAVDAKDRSRKFADFTQHLKKILKRHHLSLEDIGRSLPPLEPINCVELLIAAMIVYRDAQLKPWGALVGMTRDADSRGTVLLEQARVQDGFTTWYYSRDTHIDKYLETVRKHLYGPPQGHVVRGKLTHRRIDVGIHITKGKFVLNFAPDHAHHAHKDERALDELRNVPFALGAADWGTHTFVLSNGYVYEDHWKEGPEEHVFQKSSFEDFSRRYEENGAGVIATPPGAW